MTRDEARRLLDAVRDGADVPPAEIMRALVVTGDATGRELLAEDGAA